MCSGGNSRSITILFMGGIISFLKICFDVVMLILYPLNEFSGEVVFPDIGQQPNWSGILTLIELGLAACVFVLVLTTAYPYLYIAGDSDIVKCSTYFYALLTIGSVIVSVYRMSESGMISDNGICKRLDGFVCPTVRYRSEFDIVSTADCTFNSFGTNPDVWTHKVGIDWSNKTVYDIAARAELFGIYINTNVSNSNIKEASDMLLYHDCFYWGCDTVCNDLHFVNAWKVYASIVMSVMYAVLVILSIYVSTASPSPSPSSSDNKGFRSPPSKSRSLNLRLRM